MKNCKFQKVCLKNHTCYFDDIIDFEDFDFDILIAEKSRKNILIYNLSYKTLIGPKPVHIWFNKFDRFIKVYDRTRYLELFGPEQYDSV